MSRRNMPMGGNNNMIMGGGDGSYVSAEMLKQVDTPVETMLGVANGGLSGLVISAVISGVVSAGGHDGKKELLKAISKNWTGKHMVPIIAGTTALGALGGIVRYSRAVKHNEWSDRHYAFLESERAQANNDRRHDDDGYEDRRHRDRENNRDRDRDDDRGR